MVGAQPEVYTWTKQSPVVVVLDYPWRILYLNSTIHIKFEFADNRLFILLVIDNNQVLQLSTEIIDYLNHISLMMTLPYILITYILNIIPSYSITTNIFL